MILQRISKALRQSLACVLACASLIFGTPKAEAAVPYPNNLYLTQVGAVTCTLVASAMMIRARMYLSNNSNWPNCNEDTLYPIAWAPGLYNSFAWNRDGVYVHVTSTTVNGLTLAGLKSWMASHPEGVLIHVPVLYYNGSQTSHGQWITDIENDIVYSADTSWSGYFGRRPITNTFLGQCMGAQSTILAGVRTIWYIDSYNIPANTSYTIDAITNFPNGTYRIACASNGNYGLEVANAATNDEANVQIAQYTGGTNQQFEVTRTDSHYNFKAVHSGKNVDLYMAGSSAGTNVMQYTPDGTAVQNWQLADAGNGTYYIVNSNGLYLDVKDGTIANGTNVQVWTGNKSEAQKWVFVNVENKQTIPDGDYQIRSAKNFDYSLDVSDVSLSSGANIHLWSAANADNQKWAVKYLGYGYYSIIAKHSGMALNLAGATYTGGPNVQQHTYTANDAGSMWILKQADNGNFYVINKNGRFLDLNNGTIANGTNIGGWTGNSSDAQKWKFVAVNGEQNVLDGTYVIRSAANQTFGLDVDNSSTSNGGNIHLWTIASSNNNNQKFIIKHISDGYYSIVAKHSNLALDVENAGINNGANIQQYANSAATNDAQQWILRDAGNGTFYIINKRGLFLDINGGTLANGTNIQGWTGNGTVAQKWILEAEEVVKPVDVTGITISESDITLEAGKTATLTASVLPANATNKNVVWSSDNTAVATVANGVVTAKAEGNATITVKSAENSSILATCEVTVVPAPPVIPTTYSLEEVWSTTDIPAAADARQATVANGKLYIQDKANKKIYVYDHSGKTSTVLSESGVGTNITSDDAGNIIVRASGIFPNAIAQNEVLKVYRGGNPNDVVNITVNQTWAVGRADYFGRVRGNILSGEAIMPVVDGTSNSTTIAFWGFTNGQYDASRSGKVTGSDTNYTQGIVSAFIGGKNLYLSHVSRLTPLRIGVLDFKNGAYSFDTTQEITTPGKYSTTGADAVVLGNNAYVAYNIGTGYFDGFAISQVTTATSNAAVITHNQTFTTKKNEFQTNWVLFDKVNEYTAYIYHYHPGNNITCYMLQVPGSSVDETLQDIATAKATVIGGIGEINVIGEANSVEIYSISGGLIAKNKTQVNVAPGAYIVRVNGKATKVVVK